MTDDNDQQTLQDLFRVINDMRGEMCGEIGELRSEMNARFDATDAKIDMVRDELKGETQAIREVVDTLASQEDFAGLDRKISAVSADTQATRQVTQDVKAEVSRLRANVKAAGIPVR